MSDQDITKQEVNGQETNTIEPAAEEKTVMDFPAEWLRIANRPDGSRKATIMYYVDFSPLFTDGEKMLKKIRDVLHVFEENRDQATVVWHQDRLIDKYLKNDAP
ncbi:MAG: hypothetical protein II800_06980, partial [Lachnospiraceae bacterium]|nr:hypothetical protein [Lachnospiraceae bacterium]